MEDSGIWYYLLLGAIYILSKMFGKKKAPQGGETADFPDADPVEQSTPKRRKSTPTFEELLRELTEEVTPKEERIPDPEPVKPIEPAPVARPTIVDYQSENIEAVQPDELIDIVPHKQIERKKPVYGRSEKYAIKEERNEVREGVEELIQDHTGLQQAFVLKELLDRKY